MVGRGSADAYATGGAASHGLSLPAGVATLAVPAGLERAGGAALGVGAAAAVAVAAGAFFTPDQFVRSYLTGFMWTLAFPLGALAVLMLHHLSRGAWGVMIRRPLEAAAGTLPFLLLAFLPIALGMRRLYEWTHADVVAKDPMLTHKAVYLNGPAFLARAAVCFAIWIALAWLLTRWSTEQDATGEPALSLRMRSVSAAGFILYVLSMSVAAVDWLMSLTPHWYSTIYGLYVIVGQGVTAMAFVSILTLSLGSGSLPAVPLQKRHVHDYGKLLFAFTMVWAYFALSQFLIIWAGNLPEETSWLVPRMNGAWKGVSVVLVVLHYAVPFFVLLGRERKRDPGKLLGVAVLLLAVRWLDLHWLVAPAFSPGSFTLHWLDLAVPVALGGLWFFLFVRLLKRRPLLPVREPFLKEALADE